MHDDIIKGILNGDRRMVARAISLIENEDQSKYQILRQLFPYTGKARVLGITGPPGTGKSSLVNLMLKKYCEDNLAIGVIAVDPTSSFSGGAVLGDRIRMQENANDKDIFIRSMGTRGSLGGLSRTAKDAVQVLEASGKNVIIIETVGVGQSEIDIVKYADTTIVVLNPAVGDSIQTIKAGIMEIADIFVLNKADLAGADRSCSEISMMLDLSNSKKWRPPVIKTIATGRTGIIKMQEAIEKHRTYLQKSGCLQTMREERIRRNVVDLVENHIKGTVWSQVSNNGKFDEMVQQIMCGEVDPYSAASQMLDSINFEYSEVF